MTLKKYRAKRNFKRTPEPAGKIKKHPSTSLLYLIQKHAASHLHYDLRLELNGVLKSWAVPKGPSLDPTVKRLAVHVEDHPLEYGSFEGIISQDQYGGGAVLLWDTGTWECQDANANEAYKKGHLTFLLKGKKLKGLWKLVQIKTDPKNWLLIKVKDKYAKSGGEEITQTKPRSVVTNRLIDEITDSTKDVPKSTMPDTIYPQLATLVEQPPNTKEWLHEIKLDGYRLICFIQNKKIKILSRNQKDTTKDLPYLVEKLKKANLSSCILDGELVAVNKNNQFDFQLLQNSIHGHETSTLIYYTFDLLYYNGYDLTSLPLLARKKLLREIIPENDPLIRYGDHIIGNGIAVFKKTCELGLEGIVSKKIDSPYIQDRTHFWLKTKCTFRQEFIIGGYTKPKGERKFFGSLLLGVYEDGDKLRYCGHVGTGFSEETLRMLGELLEKYKTSTMPFSHLPPDVKKATWVKPELMVEVTFAGWTQDKILRQPSFKGLRDDKKAREIVIEKPSKPVKTTYPLTNPTKILYPEQGITKLELATFYDAIHDWILPYIINRPLSLVRCPDGQREKCFYQKHMIDEPTGTLHVIHIQEKEKTQPYVYIKDKEGLISLVQMGVLEIHPWGSTIDELEKPDIIIFDIDPAPDVEWKKVIQAARFIRDELEKLGITSFVKTTGGKGLHVTVPIKPQRPWEEIKIFSKTFVKYLVSLKPESYVDVMTKSKRAGKIYLDYLRNQRGATAIAPYSTRAFTGAPVATPLSWEELSPKIKSASYTIKNLVNRLDKLKVDPWKNFYNLKQTLKF